MFKKIMDHTESDSLKLLVLKLKSNAQTWLATQIEKNPNIKVNELLTLMSNQFGSTKKTHEYLNEFLQLRKVENKEEYERLLDLAFKLRDKDCIGDNALIKLVIEKCPTELKPLLFKFTIEDGEWYNFLKEARESSWIAFQEEKLFYQKENQFEEKILRVQKDFKKRDNRNYLNKEKIV